jgi:hypothetical protein
MSFWVPPEMLVRLVSQHNECHVSPDRLKIEGEVWTYVATLVKAPEKEKEDE